MLTLNNLLQCYNTKPKIMTKNNSIGTNYTKWTANLKFKDFSKSQGKKKFFFQGIPGLEGKNPEIQGFPGFPDSVRTLQLSTAFRSAAPTLSGGTGEYNL